ncbi:hypothetical protein OV203_19395 [Nannocystis sp. ILAH1]|uniref:hypothetical protein n=1 Tax=unclassified Nannocystis TaxID=2627009 RepID=UPI00226DFE7E|nr:MULTISPECIES: hypothetical protein [unclassified Nannocystis]MCY0989313.1 hypothetical protein [Nannocystis sp. ILAH1]MCY1064992.1 hypothetical protein [Nannocystis sp. RBIL2]
MAPGLLVQALESRGAAVGDAWRVEIGEPCVVEIAASVKCHDSSCGSSGGAHSVSSAELAGVVVMLDIVPDTGAPASSLPQLPFRIGQEFVSPISGWISLDSDSQDRAKAEIQEKGASRCNNIELAGMSIVNVTSGE